MLKKYHNVHIAHIIHIINNVQNSHNIHNGHSVHNDHNVPNIHPLSSSFINQSNSLLQLLTCLILSLQQDPNERMNQQGGTKAMSLH